VRVALILAGRAPLPAARHVVFTSYGLAEFFYGDKPLRPFTR
jgi:hypothetical protein